MLGCSCTAAAATLLDEVYAVLCAVRLRARSRSGTAAAATLLDEVCAFLRAARLPSHFSVPWVHRPWAALEAAAEGRVTLLKGVRQAEVFQDRRPVSSRMTPGMDTGAGALAIFGGGAGHTAELRRVDRGLRHPRASRFAVNRRALQPRRPRPGGPLRSRRCPGALGRLFLPHLPPLRGQAVLGHGFHATSNDRRPEYPRP